jgi:hypothetical protein
VIYRNEVRIWCPELNNVLRNADELGDINHFRSKDNNNLDYI